MRRSDGSGNKRARTGTTNLEQEGAKTNVDGNENREDEHKAA